MSPGDDHELCWRESFGASKKLLRFRIKRLVEAFWIRIVFDVDHGGVRGTHLKKARGRLPEVTLEFRQTYSRGPGLLGKTISATIFCGFHGIETLLMFQVPFL